MSVPADALTGNRIQAAPLRLEAGHLLEVDHHSAPSGSMQPWVVAWVFLAGGARREVLSVSDTKIAFALESGAKIEASLVADANPVAQAVSGAIVTQYSAVFGLTDDDVAKLAQSPIVLLRVSRGGDQFSSYDVQKGKKGKFAKFPAQVQCLLDEVSL